MEFLLEMHILERKYHSFEVYGRGGLCGKIQESVILTFVNLEKTNKGKYKKTFVNLEKTKTKENIKKDKIIIQKGIL